MRQDRVKFLRIWSRQQNRKLQKLLWAPPPVKKAPKAAPKPCDGQQPQAKKLLPVKPAPAPAPKAQAKKLLPLQPSASHHEIQDPLAPQSSLAAQYCRSSVQAWSQRAQPLQTSFSARGALTHLPCRRGGGGHGRGRTSVTTDLFGPCTGPGSQQEALLEPKPAALFQCGQRHLTSPRAVSAQCWPKGAPEVIRVVWSSLPCTVCHDELLRLACQKRLSPLRQDRADECMFPIPLPNHYCDPIHTEAAPLQCLSLSALPTGCCCAPCKGQPSTQAPRDSVLSDYCTCCELAWLVCLSPGSPHATAASSGGKKETWQTPCSGVRFGEAQHPGPRRIRTKSAPGRPIHQAGASTELDAVSTLVDSVSASSAAACTAEGLARHYATATCETLVDAESEPAVSGLTPSRMQATPEVEATAVQETGSLPAQILLPWDPAKGLGETIALKCGWISSTSS